jgi:hypothetical protein
MGLDSVDHEELLDEPGPSQRVSCKLDSYRKSLTIPIESFATGYDFLLHSCAKNCTFHHESMSFAVA